MTTLSLEPILSEERERCARVADAIAEKARTYRTKANAPFSIDTQDGTFQFGKAIAGEQIAKAIRALGPESEP